MLTSHLNDAISACEHALKTGIAFNNACKMLGNVLQGVGRFQDAVVWHTYALEQQPNRAAAFAGLGSLYAKQQQWKQAISAYEQALQLNPNYAEAHRCLAKIHAQLGDRQTEVAYRYQAVRLNPRWATSDNQLLLGNELVEVDRIEEAIECYQRAIQLHPELYEAHYNLGVLFVQQERWQDAQAVFTQALQLYPESAEVYYGLGKAASAQADQAAAIVYYRRATELDPESVSAHYSLGEILLQERHWQEAEQAYRRVVELNEQFPWAHHNLGYALLKQGLHAEAVSTLYRAIELQPDSPWTYYHLGDALLLRQQWREAAHAFLQAIQLQVDLASVYQKLGYALRKQVQTSVEDPLIDYQQAMPLREDDCTPDYYRQLADRLQQQQQFHAATVFYRLALDLQPHDLGLQQQMEKALAGQKHLDQAIANDRQEIQQHPNHTWVYTRLANLLADQGEIEEAISLHRQAGVMKGWQAAAHRHYQFTHDWFTHNISNWLVHLKPFMHYPSVKALEIGSFEGMSACWLLDHVLTHPAATLSCIDLYFQDAFDANVAQTGAAEKITKLGGDSHTILASLSPNTYDLIYIDGCHLADHAEKDALLAWPLLKAGGIMIFDDYEWFDPAYPGQETKVGIEAFLKTVHLQVEVLHKGYQLLIRKKFESAFV